VPRSLPALLRAYKIGKRAASTGFDWNNASDVVAKIEEEVAELRETLDQAPTNAARAAEEMGDLLFAIANLSRKLGIEPETALRHANDKFTRRFEQLEQRVTASGKSLDGMTLDEMESVWQEIKKDEDSSHETTTTKIPC
jgi:MazG family protein